MMLVSMHGYYTHYLCYSKEQYNVPTYLFTEAVNVVISSFHFYCKSLFTETLCDIFFDVKC